MENQIEPSIEGGERSGGFNMNLLSGKDEKTSKKKTYGGHDEAQLENRDGHNQAQKRQPAQDEFFNWVTPKGKIYVKKRSFNSIQRNYTF